jgi:hypothetical protein
MWTVDPCDEPFLWHGDFAHCWATRGHDGTCEQACQLHPDRAWLKQIGEDW